MRVDMLLHTGIIILILRIPAFALTTLCCMLSGEVLPIINYTECFSFCRYNKEK